MYPYSIRLQHLSCGTGYIFNLSDFRCPNGLLNALMDYTHYRLVSFIFIVLRPAFRGHGLLSRPYAFADFMFM